MWQYQRTDELYHHGVLGMRWGHRKSQHKTFNNRRLMSAYKKQSADAADLRKHGYIKEADAVQKVANKSKAKAIASQQKYDAKQKNKLSKGQKVAIGAAAIAAVLAAGYGGYKLAKIHKEKVTNGKKVIEQLQRMSMESEVKKGVSKSYLNQLSMTTPKHVKDSKLLLNNRAFANSVISDANIKRQANAKVVESALKEKATKKQRKEIAELVKKIKDSGNDAFNDERLRKSINDGYEIFPELKKILKK